MASVVWHHYLHVHDAADPTDSIRLVIPEAAWTDTLDGEVRSYGSRRIIAVTDTDQREVPYLTELGSRETWEWLHARRGRLLVWRDPAGQVVYGTTFEIVVEVQSHDWVLSWTVHATTDTPAAAA